MPMVDFLERAETIARTAHKGQLYGHRDYIEAHVSLVVDIIRRLGYGPEHQATGWLHDTKEDCGLTDEFLLAESIPLTVVRAVDLLTVREGVSHDDYLAGILTDPLATVAKFADSTANFASTMALSPDLTDRLLRDWGLEYADNIAILRPHLPVPDAA